MIKIFNFHFKPFIITPKITVLVPIGIPTIFSLRHLLLKHASKVTYKCSVTFTNDEANEEYLVGLEAQRTSVKLNTPLYCTRAENKKKW